MPQIVVKLYKIKNVLHWKKYYLPHLWVLTRVYFQIITLLIDFDKVPNCFRLCSSYIFGTTRSTSNSEWSQCNLCCCLFLPAKDEIYANNDFHWDVANHGYWSRAWLGRCKVGYSAYLAEYKTMRKRRNNEGKLIYENRLTILGILKSTWQY